MTSPNTRQQIANYLDSLPEDKRKALGSLHQFMLRLMPNEPLWYLDGKNKENKTIANPNIGYGQYTMHLAGGKTREFYQLGISANQRGVSIYVMGLPNKNYLVELFGNKLPRAKISSYCIQLSNLQQSDFIILEQGLQEIINRLLPKH